MKPVFHLLLMVFAFLLNGCTTVYYLGDTPKEKPNYQSMAVYVTNPDHKAYPVLKKSGIYTLTDDANWPNKLTLDRYEGVPLCGMGYLATLYSLGIVPTSFRDTYNLTYNLTTPDASKFYWHRIRYESTTSLWSSFLILFTKSEESVQAKALSRSQRQNCTIENCSQEF